MADGRCRQEWDHTASLLAAIASIFAKNGSTPKPSDFHPYLRRERKSEPIKKVGVKFLKALFIDRDKKAIAEALAEKG